MLSVIRNGFGLMFKAGRMALTRTSGPAKASLASKWTRHGQQTADALMALTGIAGAYYVADTATRWVSGAEDSISGAASKLDDYAKISIMIAGGLGALYILTRRK